MTLPTHHVRPPLGWLNDPNGPIHWRGRYHLFFQYNPDSHRHHRICWGHVSSTDLVHWQDEGVALRPGDSGPDAAGCWSGCIVADGDRAVAVYTGSAPRQSVCLAFAEDDDLRDWTKHPVPVAESPLGDSSPDFRDPFVFVHAGRRLAIVAGSDAAGGPVLYLYSCDDLTDWHLLGTLLDSSDPVAATVADARFWECPHLFTLDGRWVLILSLLPGQDPGRVVYLVGDLPVDGDGFRFVARSGGLVDHGHDFYAAAVLPESDRALLWGWSWEDRPDPEIEADGWAGTLTLTRELTLTPDDRLVSTPVGLPQPPPGLSEMALTPGTAAALPAGPLDLWLEIEPSATGLATLTWSDRLHLDLDLAAGTLAVRKDVVAAYRRDWAVDAPLPDPERVRLRVITDGSIVEVYLPDGATFTERSYPSGPATLLLSADSDARCTVQVNRLDA